MNNQPKLYLDPRPIANQLFNNFKELYRRDNTGNLYLPWKDKPSIINGEEYFTHPNTVSFDNPAHMSRIQDLGSIGPLQKNIFNFEGKLVLLARETHLVVQESLLPLVELEIIKALLENTLMEVAAWIETKDKIDPYDLVRSYVISYQEYHRKMGKSLLDDCYDEYQNWADLGIIRTIRTIEPLTKQVTRFINEDTWMIHSIHQEGPDLVIEKVIDYRISEYERLRSLGALPS